MIKKEVRALLPAWSACALAIIASRWQVRPVGGLTVPAYVIGTAGLGAWAVGHEYAHGTLTSLLTLPVPRGRSWATKLAVLAPMLAGLSALGMLLFVRSNGDQEFGVALFILPALAALFVAPWLTMETRSPLAGAVFTIGALGGSLAAGEWIGELRYGFTGQVDAFRLAFLWWAMGGLATLGAVMGWRRFASLETLDGHSADVQLPTSRTRAVTRTRVTRRHPLIRLIAKELRLQQLSIVVAAVWALAYTISEASGARATYQSDFFSSNLPSVLTVFYTLVLPIVIGSLPCAEERQLGTLDAQLLLPGRSSTQWVVKSATAFSLTVILALVLPLALARILGDAGWLFVPGTGNRLPAELVVSVLAITSISLYVSTIARSGMWALIWSVGAVIASGVVVSELLNLGIGRKVFAAVHAARAPHPHLQFMALRDVYVLVPLCGFAVLAVALALPHYRYAARRPALIAGHAVIAVAYVMACNVVVNVLWALEY